MHISKDSHSVPDHSVRFAAEEHFHDDWASSVKVEDINVVKMNEAVTAPEMRFIVKTLGDLRGKKLLDVGCGLGEASVYFALKGAQVTSTDLSGEMLHFVEQLARHNGVDIRTHKSTAENLCFAPGERFDVIYVGNLFHHVNIDATIQRLIPLLNTGGMLVSWDPIAYNPIINVYRRIATKVRTKDEHPLTLRDIQLFKDYFRQVDVRYFWFTTLLIFILMFLQGRSPNRERYWKKVIEEEERWRWLYKPLERLDHLLLRVFPFFRPLCWGVVIAAREPKI